MTARVRVRRKHPDMARVQSRIMKRALARAITRGLRSIRATSAREVAKKAGLRVRDVRRATNVRSAKVRDLTGALTARGRPLNLINFRARQTRQGVRARAYGRVRLYQGVWIGRNVNAVFVRTRRTGRRIRGVFGPGIANSYLTKVQSRRFLKQGSRVITKVLNDSYAYQLSRAGFPVRR